MNAVTKYAAMAFISTLIFVQSVSAQQINDVETLQRRINSLESKVDALVDLMQKQQESQKNTAASPNVISSTRPTNTNVPYGFVNGLYLDVYASEKGRFEEDARKDTLPSGFPSASAGIVVNSSFQYDELNKHSETKNFAVKALPPTVVYSGYLMIKESGRHAIGVNITTRGDRCTTKLFINEKLIISRSSKSDFDSANSALDLNNGLYKFQLSFICGGHMLFKYEGHQIDLVMAGPQDRAPKAIPADLFFIKQ